MHFGRLSGYSPDLQLTRGELPAYRSQPKASLNESGLSNLKRMPGCARRKPTHAFRMFKNL
jgi:hypothetical protein